MGDAADTVRSVYAAMQAGDTATVMALYPPDARWDMSRSIVDYAAFVDREDARREAGF